MQDDYEGDIYDTSLDKFRTYQEYLDSHITAEDRFYLEDIQLARQLKQEGYHAKTQILSRQAFYAKKKAIQQAKQNQNKDKTKALASTVANMKNCPFLKALAQRQQKVLNGRQLTIIFMRVERIENYKQKYQISGYIDYAHRLKTQDFRQYFDGTKMLMPKTTDLSYYNWKTGNCVSNDSPNFKVDANSGSKRDGKKEGKQYQSGLLFRNKRDRKVINVHPDLQNQQNVTRTAINDALSWKKDDKQWILTQVALYDHLTRRKN